MIHIYQDEFTYYTVTNRAQGNNYVGATGIEFAVQTGFCIRTGFYITNSGSDTMLMSLSTTNNYEAFEFISGVNEEVVITLGSTKLIPFNFKGIKDSSGPSNASGPETLYYLCRSLVLFLRQIELQTQQRI